MSGRLVLCCPSGNFLENSASHECFSKLDAWIITLWSPECLILVIYLVITLNSGCAKIHLHLSNTFNVAVTNCKYCERDEKNIFLLQANVKVFSMSLYCVNLLRYFHDPFSFFILNKTCLLLQQILSWNPPEIQLGFNSHSSALLYIL